MGHKHPCTALISSNEHAHTQENDVGPGHKHSRVLVPHDSRYRCTYTKSGTQSRNHLYWLIRPVSGWWQDLKVTPRRFPKKWKHVVLSFTRSKFFQGSHYTLNITDSWISSVRASLIWTLIIQEQTSIEHVGVSKSWIGGFQLHDF